MPLVKPTEAPLRAETRPPSEGDDADLRAADPARRRAAVNAVASGPGAVDVLAGALATESDPATREAIVTALIRIGDPSVARALLPFLRSDDAATRSEAVEALQSIAEAALPYLSDTLDDQDPDVRIMAVEVVRRAPADEATRLLCRMLEHEDHPNACAAAVDVLAEVGTPDALPTLRALARRFAGDAFLPFALSVAIARIEGTDD